MTTILSFFFLASCLCTLIRFVQVGDFYIKMDIDYKPKVDCSTNCHIVTDLYARLSHKQLALFRETCFGKFLNLLKICVQGRVLHNLLMRQVHSVEQDVMHFSISGVDLRFGLAEFALITGLKCKGNTNITISYDGNQLLEKCFKGAKTVTWTDLENCFKRKKFKSDEDAVKMAVLYFVYTFLFSMTRTKVLYFVYTQWGIVG